MGDLALEAHVSPQTIIDAENGRLVDPGPFKRIANALGHQPEELRPLTTPD